MFGNMCGYVESLPLFSTISRIPTTLKYLPLFPVSECGIVETMPFNFPMGVIVFEIVVLAIGVIVLQG